MVKDFFGVDRFHCAEYGCSCAQFLSQANIDMDQAHAAGEDELSLLESSYHSMTCQAKSMYQLICQCGHGAPSHSNKISSACVFDGTPCALFVLQGVNFRKTGDDPVAAAITRVKMANGTRLWSTGRTWRGPSGGLWTELDSAVEAKGGWVLIEGPGFGLKGPVLGNTKPQQEHLPQLSEAAELKTRASRVLVDLVGPAQKLQHMPKSAAIMMP